MNVPSDDFFAEMLAKQLGAHSAGMGSTAAGAHVVTEQVAAYGVHPRVVDGSGLSPANRTSPHQVVEVLQLLWHTPVGDVLSGSLPILGVNGTVSQIAKGTGAQGRCRAKTGTLEMVSNLAGYCQTRSRDPLAFAIFLDDLDSVRATDLLGRMAAAIARY